MEVGKSRSTVWVQWVWLGHSSSFSSLWLLSRCRDWTEQWTSQACLWCPRELWLGGYSWAVFPVLHPTWKIPSYNWWGEEWACPSWGWLAGDWTLRTEPFFVFISERSLHSVNLFSVQSAYFRPLVVSGRLNVIEEFLFVFHFTENKFVTLEINTCWLVKVIYAVAGNKILCIH